MLTKQLPLSVVGEPETGSALISYADTLRTLNRTSYAHQSRPVSFHSADYTLGLRYWRIYARLRELALRCNQPLFRVAIMGPGLENEQRFTTCPQLTEVQALLRNIPHEITLVGWNEDNLRSAKEARQYHKYWYPWDEIEDPILKAYVNRDLLPVLINGERFYLNSHDWFELNATRFGNQRTEIFAGYFQNIQYGEQLLNGILATASLYHVFTYAPAEAIDTLGRMLRALKPGGKLWFESGPNILAGTLNELMTSLQVTRYGSVNGYLPTTVNQRLCARLYELSGVKVNLFQDYDIVELERQ